MSKGSLCGHKIEVHVVNFLGCSLLPVTVVKLISKSTVLCQMVEQGKHFRYASNSESAVENLFFLCFNLVWTKDNEMLYSMRKKLQTCGRALSDCHAPHPTWWGKILVHKFGSMIA